MEYDDAVEEVNCVEKLARLLLVAPAPLFPNSANSTSALWPKLTTVGYGKEYMAYVLEGSEFHCSHPVNEYSRELKCQPGFVLLTCSVDYI